MTIQDFLLYEKDGGWHYLNLFNSLSIPLIMKVDAVASNLNSNDAFVLVSPSGSVLWIGQGVSNTEKHGAKQLGEILGVEISEVAEGEEGGMMVLTWPLFCMCVLNHSF